MLGHQFADRDLLLVALTHRSFSHEAPAPCSDNEALEFLGDAILAFVVSDRLYRAFPGLDEGRLSKHKHLLVSCGTLADAARLLGLGEHLRRGRGEVLSGEPNPKVLSNLFEAIVAAIYLDAGLEPASAFLDRVLGSKLAGLDASHPLTDYKSMLQELVQGRGMGIPSYRVLEETGPDHSKVFRVMVSVDGADLAEGQGSTKRQAHQQAAREAIEGLSR